jgi:hemolysin activation/secretion protein
VEVFSSRIGETVSRPLLDDIGDDIQSKYRRDGYVAPAVVVLDTELRSSTPRIHVLEAAIEEIELRGNAGPYSGTVMDRARELRGGAIEVRRMQAFLQRLRQLPGLTIRASFEPRASSPNQMSLVLDAQYEAVSGAVSVNNRGTEELGRTLIAGRISANGLLGSQSAVSLRAATSEESDRYRYVGARVERSVSLLTAGLDASESRAELESGYEYESRRSRIEVRTTWVRDEALEIEPFTALTWRDAEGRYPEMEISQMRTRTLELGAVTRYAHARTSAYVRSGFTLGMDALGARAYDISDSPADLSFSKVSVDVGVIRALSNRWRVRVDAEGQWSDADLPAGERFAFGGATLGRAFDVAELIGDKGGALGVQLEQIQRWKHLWLQQSSVYVQSDYGYASDRVYGSDAAASLTAGIKAWLPSAVARLELSTPVMRAQSAEPADDVRAFAEIQFSF